MRRSAFLTVVLVVMLMIPSASASAVDLAQLHLRIAILSSLGPNDGLSVELYTREPGHIWGPRPHFPPQSRDVCYNLSGDPIACVVGTPLEITFGVVPGHEVFYRLSLTRYSLGSDRKRTRVLAEDTLVVHGNRTVSLAVSPHKSAQPLPTCRASKLRVREPEIFGSGLTGGRVEHFLTGRVTTVSEPCHYSGKITFAVRDARRGYLPIQNNEGKWRFSFDVPSGGDNVSVEWVNWCGRTFPPRAEIGIAGQRYIGGVFGAEHSRFDLAQCDSGTKPSSLETPFLDHLFWPKGYVKQIAGTGLQLHATRLVKITVRLAAHGPFQPYAGLEVQVPVTYADLTRIEVCGDGAPACRNRTYTITTLRGQPIQVLAGMPTSFQFFGSSDPPARFERDGVIFEHNTTIRAVYDGRSGRFTRLPYLPQTGGGGYREASAGVLKEGMGAVRHPLLGDDYITRGDSRSHRQTTCSDSARSRSLRRRARQHRLPPQSYCRAADRR